jgi:HK97 family phage prohead protease
MMKQQQCLTAQKYDFCRARYQLTAATQNFMGQHDSNQILGKVVDRVDTPQGMMFTAKLSATRLADEYMTLMVDGVIDAVSVGVNPTKFSYDDDGTMVIESADWSELSLVSEGAFSGAVITEVAASIPQTEPELELNKVIPTQEKNMSEQIETPVAETAASTVDKLWAQPKKEFRYRQQANGSLHITAVVKPLQT